MSAKQNGLIQIYDIQHFKLQYMMIKFCIKSLSATSCLHMLWLTDEPKQYDH